MGGLSDGPQSQADAFGTLDSSGIEEQVIGARCGAGGAQDGQRTHPQQYGSAAEHPHTMATPASGAPAKLDAASKPCNSAFSAAVKDRRGGSTRPQSVPDHSNMALMAA